MAAQKHLICRSVEVVEAGDGVRFNVPGDDLHGGAAFVVRYGGRLHAYLNRCAHVPVELDWMPGKFFDLTGHLLVCAVHGAHYDPRNGRCVMGPCKGGALRALSVVEEHGAVYLVTEGGG
ncbi:Rieske 2Fe-2S domain-containing protein [Azoarcus sp. L1K30]|uniref:Rieske (2Fe-2S) protein n=1 Tax=Azoarcus sp. L1K30 TaxID=2820277 RepID=UPI001B83278B|nr:Rieske 2Fe-2S domain-containing protein [Azoarcus sp. L1K30]MBR0565726.1 Rieske 2Fe-2S domain-containing protein [Azoarcus sp. L1K30]